MQGMQSMALTFHPKSLNKMGVFTKTLTINDLDKIIDLENASFSEEERGTIEKFRYRLTVCGELSLGLCTMSKPHPDTPKGVSDFKPKEILVGMIIGTKTSSNRVTDASMQIPKALLSKFSPQTDTATPAPATRTEETPQSKPAVTESSTATTAETKAAGDAAEPSEAAKEPVEDVEGHVEAGDTVCIHSLCISPSYRGMGYSQTLLKDYVNRMRDAGVSKRIALVCHKEVTGVYTKSGFRNLGASKVTHGGGNWIDMVHEFATPPTGKGSRKN